MIWCETRAETGRTAGRAKLETPSLEFFMSLHAKLVPRNREDVVPAVQIESPGAGQRAGSSMVPQGQLGGFGPSRLRPYVRSISGLPVFRAAENTPDLELAGWGLLCCPV